MIMGGLMHINIVRDFVFQDLLQTQGGFSWNNQLVYGGHNLYGSHGRVDGDGDDDDVNIRDEDEGDGSNERGVCDEDQWCNHIIR